MWYNCQLRSHVTNSDLDPPQGHTIGPGPIRCQTLFGPQVSAFMLVCCMSVIWFCAPVQNQITDTTKNQERPSMGYRRPQWKAVGPLSWSSIRSPDSPCASSSIMGYTNVRLFWYVSLFYLYFCSNNLSIFQRMVVSHQQQPLDLIHFKAVLHWAKEDERSQCSLVKNLSP